MPTRTIPAPQETNIAENFSPNTGIVNEFHSSSVASPAPTRTAQVRARAWSKQAPWPVRSEERGLSVRPHDEGVHRRRWSFRRALLFCNVFAMSAPNAATSRAGNSSGKARRSCGERERSCPSPLSRVALCRGACGVTAVLRAQHRDAVLSASVAATLKVYQTSSRGWVSGTHANAH